MVRWSGNPDFDLFRLPDEHNEMRTVLRDLCEKEIAPHAADVDEHSRFPDEALKALNAAGFSAVHVPEEYGGQGADAVATCIVIEEVARVMRVVVADSGSQQAGHHGADPGRLGRAEEAGAADAGVGRGDGVVCAVGARSRQRRGGDAHPGSSGRRPVDPQRHQVLDQQRRQVDVVHGDGGDRSRQGRQRNIGVHGAQGRRGLHRRPQGAQARHQGLADHRAVFRGLPHPGGPDHRRAGHRLQDCVGDAGPHPPDDRGASGRYRAGCARRGDSHTPRSASSLASRSAISRVCSSCWPTWR